ncbi:MAG: putative bifunctional diguanylate cyclase/phosphodiesterase [Cyanobium sp.]
MAGVEDCGAGAGQADASVPDGGPADASVADGLGRQAVPAETVAPAEAVARAEAVDPAKRVDPPADDPAQRRLLQRQVKRLEHELRQAVRALPHLRQMVEFSADGLLLLDGAFRVLDGNARLAELLQCVDGGELYHQPLERWLALPQEAAVLRQRLQALAPGQTLRMEVSVGAAAGRHLPMELEARSLRDADGLQPRWTVSLRDISERRRLESSEAMLQVQQTLIAELRRSEGRFRELVEQLPDGLAQLDAAQRLLFINPALEALLGEPAAALVGTSLERFLLPQDQAAWQRCGRALLAGRSCQLHVSIRDAQGQVRALELEVLPRCDGAGLQQGSTLLARDVSELKAARRELQRLSLSDPLTGLGNERSSRRVLREHLQQRSQLPLAVLWLDLDGFRRVNHSQGRASGDRLLCAVADQLRGWSRPGDWLARPGSDEFLVIRPGVDEQGAWAMAADLQRALACAVALPDGEGLGVGFSAGISLYPRHGAEGDALLRHAATALGRAHDSGQGLVLFYEPAFTETLRVELGLEGRLRQALDSGGLRLMYHPQFDGSGRLIGSEALARWRDGSRGEVSPGLFIPLAERTGMIQPLGRRALEEACAQQRRWLAAGLRPLRVAVNVSPRQLLGSAMAMSAIVQATLERHGLPPQLLELEITESGILPITGVSEEIERLAALGVTLAIDDFGTGYSSLESLHRLPIHKLKIDQNFTANLLSSDSARLIVRAALTMARELGMQSLVEGVETAEQADLLTGMGCDGFQGYHFARPLEAEDFAALLAERAADAAGG